MDKLTQEQADRIEQEHNVYIDLESGLYTNDERDGVYGWMDGWQYRHHGFNNGITNWRV